MRFDHSRGGHSETCSIVFRGRIGGDRRFDTIYIYVKTLAISLSFCGYRFVTVRVLGKRTIYNMYIIL